MNSPPLSESMPSRGTGSDLRTSSSAAKVQRRARLAHDAHLGPARGHVGDAQRVGELAAGVAAFVADEVDLDEDGPVLVPLGAGAHRDLAPEQATRLGMAH